RPRSPGPPPQPCLRARRSMASHPEPTPDRAISLLELRGSHPAALLRRPALRLARRDRDLGPPATTLQLASPLQRLRRGLSRRRRLRAPSGIPGGERGGRVEALPDRTAQLHPRLRGG